MLAIPLEAPLPVVDSGHTAALEDAFRSERRLLEDLLAALVRQRGGVAVDDIVVVDDSVFAVQRILRTLAEARRRRRALLCILVGEEDTALSELDAVLGTAMTLSLRTARDDLQDAARRVADALDHNRRLLQGAISAGDKLIQALSGNHRAPVIYPGPGAGQGGGGSLLVNTQV